jgi:hypothetical protein
MTMAFFSFRARRADLKNIPLLPETNRVSASEAETSQKKADSARLDSIQLLLDSIRLDMYFQKVPLDSYNKFLKSYFIR